MELVEYGVLTALIVVSIVAALGLLGTAITDRIQTVIGLL